jgi:D-serine deaminase-like pyridoxal phosphate-dependent protein
MKTAKTWEAGYYMTGGTGKRITVSTLAEATFFADGGFDDIVYAMPICLSKMDAVRELTERLEAFHILTDSIVMLKEIIKIRPPATKTWSVLLMLDVGYNRCGVKPSNPAALEMARIMASCDFISFAGVYAHCGQSYNTTGEEEHTKVVCHARDEIVKFTRQLEAEGIPCPCIGLGSTPGCSHTPSEMTGVTEYHPGNYVFYGNQCTSLFNYSCRCTCDFVHDHIFTIITCFRYATG